MKKLIFLLLLALPFFGFSQAAYLMEFTNPNGSKVVFNLNDVRSCVAEGAGSYLFTRTGSGKTQVQESPATIALNSCGNIVLFTVYLPASQYNTTKQMGVNPNYVVGVVSNTSGNGVLKMITPTENFTTTSTYNAAVALLSICVSGGGGGGSLTNTYVGFGDGLNQLDGEAGFTYDAEPNRLAVDTVKTKRISSKSGSLEILNDTKFNAYPNTRDDSGTPVNILNTDASGNLRSDPVSNIAPIQSASNGVSKNGTAVELGNAVGGTIGQLTSPREIPLNSQSLLISGPTLRNWKFDADGLYSVVDNTKSYGIGYQLGLANTGANFSGGAGYALGNANTGANFSGGAGYALGFQNTGDYFSGGAGYALGTNNTGANFSGGAGYALGYLNTGDFFSGGAGYLLGNANTGANFSGGAGYALGFQNTGDYFSGGAGYALGTNNTGANFSGGAGFQLGYQNTGTNFSGGAGRALGYLNTGDDFVGLGANTGEYNRGNNSVFIGANSGTPVVLTTGSAILAADVTGGVISGTSATSIIADLSGVNGQYYPVTISNYGTYQLKVVGATLTGGPSSIAVNETYTTYQKIDNVAVFGNNVDYTKANQVNIGNSDQTEIRFSEKYAFDVSATLGAGDNGKVFSYDNGTGQFELTTPSSISISAVGSTPNANAATISGSTLNLQPANASYPGVVSTTTQTIAGQKTIAMSNSAGVTQNLILDNTGTAAVNSAASLAQSVAGSQKGEWRTTLTELGTGGADWAKTEIKAQDGGALEVGVLVDMKNAGVDNVAILPSKDGSFTAARRIVTPYSNVALTGDATLTAGYSTYVLTGTQILTDVWTITMPTSASMLDGEIITITNSVPGVTGATLQLTANSGQTLFGFTGTISFANPNGFSERKAIQLMFKTGGTWITLAHY